MELNAIKKSTRRLREARNRVPRLRALQISLAAAKFDQEWFEFLGTLNSIPEMLKTGAKPHPKSRQWFAGKERIIRKDPLLSYLHHSRGGDFHGHDRVMKLTISPGNFIYEDHDIDDLPPVNAGRLDIPLTVNRFKLWYEPQLVKDHHGNKFLPPDLHLGYQIFDRSAAGMAELSLEFYDKLTREALTFT